MHGTLRAETTGLAVAYPDDKAQNAAGSICLLTCIMHPTPLVSSEIRNAQTAFPEKRCHDGRNAMVDMQATPIEHKHQGKIVAQYRRFANLSQRDLAELMHVSTHTVQRMEQEAVIKELDRRRFLVALLGIPAAYLGLDHEQQEIEKTIFIFNDDSMSFLEDMLATRWKTHLMGGPLHAAHSLDRLVNEVITFAQQVQGQAWQKRAQVQLCMAYQLQGSIASDMMRYKQALEAYRNAFAVAHELHDVELMAAVRVREGIIFMRREKPLQAIMHLTNALELVNGQGFPELRGNILAVLSEAYAKAQRPQESSHTIGLAERALEQTESVRERSYRMCSAASVTAHKGIDALLLHDYDRALRLIEKSLKTYNPTLTPGRARLLARKAEAHYGLHSLSECIDTAEQALTLANSVGASNTVVRVKQLHAALAQSRWSREPGVLRLGALLAGN